MVTVKGYKGLPMEGLIATWYARNTGRDTRRFMDTARLVAARARPGGDVLEVAPGPGYLAIEMARRWLYRDGARYQQVLRAHSPRERGEARRGRRRPAGERLGDALGRWIDSISSCAWRPSRISPTRSARSMRCTGPEAGRSGVNP